MRYVCPRFNDMRAYDPLVYIFFLSVPPAQKWPQIELDIAWNRELFC